MKYGMMKRTAAALCAVVLAVSMLAGCSKTDYSLTANGEKVNAGVYINYLLNEMTSEMSTMYYAQTITDPKEALEKDVDGQNFKAYVKEKAIKDTKEFAAINAKFNELGLKLSKDDKAAVKDSLASSWEQSAEFYESEGVSKESLKQVLEIEYKKQAIFDYYYGEGGKEEVTADDLKSYLSDNYIRYKQITFSKSYAEDEETAASENLEIKAKFDTYMAQTDGVDYEGFDALIKQYQDEQAAEEEAETAKEETEEGDTESASDATDTAESEASEDSAAEESTESLTEVEDTVSQAEAEAEAETEAETVEAPADADSAAESEADAEGETDSEAEVVDLTDDSDVDLEDVTGDADAEAEEETDYDTVVNYTTGTDKNGENYDEDYANRLTAIKKGEQGKAFSYEDDNAYYIFMTADINDKEGYAEDNRDTLVSEMKEDEFQGLIDGWVEAMKITVNDKAVKRYSVQEVYDRQEKYYSENS